MNPFEQLGLPTTATTNEVRSAWRRLASIHHPDKGGDGSMFGKLRKSYMEAIKLSKVNKSCPACDGGKIIQVRGLYVIYLNCEKCGGTGIEK